MAWKVLIFFGIALCALSEARPPKSEQKVKIENYGKLSHIGSRPEHHEVYAWSYPSYEFSYKVEDPHTHDFKEHHETRNGDEVEGYYWLIQPDGYKRTVKYRADKNSGFKAHVDYIKIYKLSNENNNEGEGNGEEAESPSEESSNGNNENQENAQEENNDNGNNSENENSNNESSGSSASENENNNNEGGEQESNGQELKERQRVDNWRRGGVNYWGQKRQPQVVENAEEEQGNGENENNNEEGGNENEGQAEENNNNNEQNQEEQGNNGTNQENNAVENGNEGNGGVENNSESRNNYRKKIGYHIIIHHPKYKSKSKKSKRRI